MNNVFYTQFINKCIDNGLNNIQDMKDYAIQQIKNIETTLCNVSKLKKERNNLLKILEYLNKNE